MATRAQTPRASQKKAGSARNSQRAVAEVFSQTNSSPLKPSNGKPPAPRQKPEVIANETGIGEPRPVVINVDQFEKLIAVLIAEGFEVVGPSVRDGAITYESVKSVSDLPAGWADEQEPGRYRLKKTGSPAFFAYSLGAQSWKRYLHPAEICLFAAGKQNGSFHILNNDAVPQNPQAFLGVRACELAAIKAQDRVLMGDKYRDPIYSTRRENTLIVAVQCSQGAETCFCSSVGSGPQVSGGFDLLLTEFADENGHRFVTQAGTGRGAEILAQLETSPATAGDMDAIEAGVAFAAQQRRKLDSDGLKEFLYDSFENPQWEKVAARCLSCANCTMACPTCFCTTVDDSTDVTGTHAERWRRWDSCFTQSFSYIHGGSIRTSSKARYRQWVTHKLAAWLDQFGSSGCVGCGRCITWCPAAIDITEEVRAMREGGVRADA